MNYRDLQNISNLSQQILVEGANEEHNVLNRWPYTSPYLQESTEVDEGYKDLGDKARNRGHQLLNKSKKTATRGNMYAGILPSNTPEGENLNQRASQQFAVSAFHNPEKAQAKSAANKARGEKNKKAFGNRLTRSDKQGIKDSYEYQLDEIFGLGKKKGTSPRADAIINSPEFKKRMEDADKIAIQNLRDMMSGDKKRQNRVAMHPDNRTDLNDYKEQVDLYDIILSHLLDEGYAETPEQAEVIMVNMSESWKNSILG